MMHYFHSGELRDVTGSIFDLRQPTLLGDVIPQMSETRGYDHNFVLRGPTGKRLAARYEQTLRTTHKLSYW